MNIPVTLKERPDVKGLLVSNSFGPPSLVVDGTPHCMDELLYGKELLVEADRLVSDAIDKALVDDWNQSVEECWCHG